VLEPSDVEDNGRGLVVFIHDRWLDSDSWQPWAALFDNSGYDCLVPSWPGEPANLAACRAGSVLMAGATFGQMADHIMMLIDSLTKRPILIGHGVGGLIARTLLGSGAACAAIALAPAPSARAHVRSIIGSSGFPPRLAAVSQRRRATVPTAAQFHRRFANAVGSAESDELYQRYVMPAVNRAVAEPLFRSNRLRRDARVAVATSRGPLLLISGGRDVLVPERRISALERRYRKTLPDQVTDHQVFPHRGHSMVIDAGWREVAYFCLDWLTRQNL
jgi:non-heme chloroperoxidase